MKNVKKMMALVIAMVMTLAMVAPAFAAVDNPEFAFDKSVSVQDLTAGDTVKYYQVLEWDQTNGAWKLAAGFTSLANDTTNFPGTNGVVADIVDGITQTQANAIAACAASATAKYTDSAITGTTSTYTLPDADSDGTPDLAAMGLYMAVVTAGTPETIYNPAFVGADFEKNNTTNVISINATYSDTSVAKKERITVLKTTSDADSDVATAIDSYVGQEVTFYVDTEIPVFLDSYQNPSFVINDAIETSGIELVANSVKVTLGATGSSTTYAKTAGDGAVAYDADIFSVTENGTAGYTVTFVRSYLDGNATAVPVHIEYKGKVTNTAAFNVNEDDNTVTITYSNGPGTEKAALKDRTNHYTFSIGAKAFGETEDSGKTYELVKVGVDQNGKPVVEEREVSSWKDEPERHPLSGATFALYKADGTTPYTNDLYPEGATFTTGADGVITFKGLAEGTYVLKETSAPDGYVKSDKAVTIVIAATYDTVTVPAGEENGVKYAEYSFDVLQSYTVSVDNASVYDSTTGTYGLSDNTVVNTYTFENDGKGISAIKESETTVLDSDITNTKGTELPSTGGIGTTMFYIIGAILVLGAGIVLVTRRRMSAN